MNALEALREHSVVVADTGDFTRMASFAPRDATTNPSLILKALAQPAGADLYSQVVSCHHGSPQERMVDLLVAFGIEILRVIPGRVSTEVDARLSFDTKATIDQALLIMERYAAAGVEASRVLIKVAATWEGIRAAEKLELRGIHCNLTLLFSMPQARACADAGVTLISPFVGRITDWYKAKGETWKSVQDDPGVRSVQEIFSDYKRRGIKTEVMGASFRTPEQVLALAGCDLLTVSPEILAQLQAMPVPADFAPMKAEAVSAREKNGKPMTEPDFRYGLNDSAMATEKLADGIRLFSKDGRALLDRLAQ